MNARPKELQIADDKISCKTQSFLLNNHEHPSHRLKVIGITGTNGKTTVSYLIGEVLKTAGYKPFVLGTLNSGSNDLSTPLQLNILRFMKNHLNRGGTHFIMEVTSEGIDQGRIDGIDFDIKLLTNITHDHLDYHRTFEKYKKVKMDFMMEGNAHRIFPEYFRHEKIDFTTKLLGAFNLLNVQAATSILRHLKIDEMHISGALSSCSPPKGRLEAIDAGQPFLVLIDYAHTPDGLENVLKTLRKLASDRGGKLLVLFGCGGDRDRNKRPLMGRIASEIADFVVLADDNPRQEESATILSEIAAGIDKDQHNYIIIPDRKSAILYIIGDAGDKDVILIAGKGHETFQILKSGTVHFDDQEEAGKAIIANILQTIDDLP